MLALWVGLGALVVAVLVGGLVLYRSHAFTIATVEVRGATTVSQDAVLKLAAVPADATLLRVDTGGISDRLATNPWIAQSKVSRKFPNTLVIRVEERVPGAIVQAGKKPWLIATDGTWITPAKYSADITPTPLSVRDVPALNPVKGAQDASPVLRNALAVVTGLSPELRSKVLSVSAPDVDKTALTIEGDIEIIVGRAEDMQKKDAIVRRILAEQQGNVVYINVRTTDRPTWRGLENKP